MTATWADARTPIDSATLRATLLAVIQANGGTVSGWPDEAPHRAIVENEASALAYESNLRVNLAGIASPATAASAGSSWVDAAVGWFGITRILATFAGWDVPLSTTSPPQTIGASSTVQIQADNGTIFLATQETPVVMNSTGTIRFTARLAGTSGNVAPNSIHKVIAGPAGLSITGSGQVLAIVARDDETDDEVIIRALGRWGTIGAGWTRQSFDYLIPLFSPTVTGWRVRDDNPTGPGSVQVISRNAAGPSSAPENAAILAGLGARAVKPLGSGQLTAISASALTVAITGTIYSDGRNGSLLDDATAALDTLAEAFPIGGDSDSELRAELVKAVLMGGRWPADKPLVVLGADGQTRSIVLPGFAGAKNISISLTDVSVGMNDTIVFDYSGLGVA